MTTPTNIREKVVAPQNQTRGCCDYKNCICGPVHHKGVHLHNCPAFKKNQTGEEYTSGSPRTGKALTSQDFEDAKKSARVYKYTPSNPVRVGYKAELNFTKDLTDKIIVYLPAKAKLGDLPKELDLDIKPVREATTPTNCGLHQCTNCHKVWLDSVSVNGGTCYKCGEENINIVGTNIHKCKPVREENQYIPGNCPFCDADNQIVSNWGMSPAGWEKMRIQHKKHNYEK